MKNMNDSLSFNVNLNNFNGPLEVLLDLAKSQKVNLEKISITILVDQFLDFIKSNEKINLDIASEYLLMATWLTYLKSKLLLPETDEEEFKALEVAEKLKLQLKKLELIRLLSRLEQGRAGQSKAEQARAGQSKPEHARAGQNKPEQARESQSKSEQRTAEQNKP